MLQPSWSGLIDRILISVRGLTSRVSPPAALQVHGHAYDGTESGRGPLEHRPVGVPIPLVDILPDSELQRLNDLLPWAAYVLDGRGRRFGKARSAKKRESPQSIPDPRILELDRRVPLRDLTVLEVGCFEGIHTVALAQRAKHVVAVDGRVENVVKTIVRCALYGQEPTVFWCNVEQPLPASMPKDYDVLHHVGVLYHLVDPVEHLRRFAALARRAIMLDTHVAPDSALLETYVSGGDEFRCFRYQEGGRQDPFSGLSGFSRWMREADLIRILKQAGFDRIDVAQRRAERNGPRVLIYATR